MIYHQDTKVEEKQINWDILKDEMVLLLQLCVLVSWRLTVWVFRVSAFLISRFSALCHGVLVVQLSVGFRFGFQSFSLSPFAARVRVQNLL
jgi:hypothetical protein